MRARYGERPANRSYEYVMMYLCNMNDEGLTILPSHRVIKSAPGFRVERFLEKAGTWFDITKFPFSNKNRSTECNILKKRLEEYGRINTTIAFYQNESKSESGRYYLFSLKPHAREEIGNDLHPALKKLDVIILSRLILQRCLGFSKDDLDKDEIFHYQTDIDATLSQVNTGNYQMAFLLNPTKIEHVREIASNYLVMPRKSTYFYPKILTGLVFNKIDPHEIIPTL